MGESITSTERKHPDIIISKVTKTQEDLPLHFGKAARAIVPLQGS